MVDRVALASRMEPFVEEVGECLLWTGSTQWKCETPVLRWGNSCLNVRRLLALADGRDVTGLMCTTRCGNVRCVLPSHVLIVTRRELQRRVARATCYEARLPALSVAARRRAKLTLEQAREIRAAEGRQRDIAKTYGVSQHTVSMIKRGLMWRDWSSPWAQLMK
jgi:hypothetical protein